MKLIDRLLIFLAFLTVIECAILFIFCIGEGTDTIWLIGGIFAAICLKYELSAKK